MVGENLRAALDWLPQGRKLLTVKTDCTLPFTPTELTLTARATPPGFASSTIDSSSRAGSRICEGDAAQSSPAQQAAAPAAADAVQPKPAPSRDYETVLDEAAFERWIGRDRSTPSWFPSTSRRLASIRCRRASSGCHSRSSPDALHTSRSRIATPARRAQLAARSGTRAPEAMVRGFDTRKRSGRTSSTTSTCSPITASRSPAWRTTRCCSRTCSNRIGRTIWTAWRGGTST